MRLRLVQWLSLLTRSSAEYNNPTSCRVLVTEESSTAMMRRVLWLLTGAVFIAAACTDALGPPAGAVGFTPPAHYRIWWAVAEACAGRTGDFDAVHWYTVPASESFSLEGQTVNGAWYQAGNKIALGANQMGNGELVRHEMVHALMQSGDHPRSIFLDQCADVVNCVERCVSDAGGPPDTSAMAVVVAPSAMDVSVEIIPHPLSLTSNNGWFSCVISAKNLAPYPVRVPVPLYDDTLSADFSWTLTPVAPATGGMARVYSPATEYVLFAPAGTAGATRRLVGDAIPRPGQLTPGQYQMSAFFVTQPAPPALLTVTP
jgi:hypothetical protein